MRAGLVAVVPLAAACGAPELAAPAVSLSAPPALALAASAGPPMACAADDGCGYDASLATCTADPRANRQPPLVDQGIICYCENSRCAMLRVWPVPCEGDESCAVDAAPRAHPVRSDARHPHERGVRCRDFDVATTCERTNICTMHRCP